MKPIIKDGQTLADLAIQEFGSLDAMIDIARENGLSMTDVPPAGTELKMPDVVYNQTMQNFVRNNDVSPATARNQSDVRLKIFTEEFMDPFK